VAETERPEERRAKSSPIRVGVLIALTVALCLVILLPGTRRDTDRKAVFVITLTAIRNAWPEEGQLDKEGLREILSTFADRTEGIEVDWQATQYRDDSRVYVVLYDEEPLSSVAVLNPQTDDATAVRSPDTAEAVDPEQVRRDIDNGKATLFCSLSRVRP
jgi:hypothetical protein